MLEAFENKDKEWNPISYFWTFIKAIKNYKK